MGSVVDGTTNSDTDPDETQMSITAAMATFEWQDRKVNLIDTPATQLHRRRPRGAARVRIGGVRDQRLEVHADRLWQRAAESTWPA